MLLLAHHWVLPSPQLRVRALHQQIPVRLACSAVSTNTTSQEVLQEWVQTQVSATDQLNRPQAENNQHAAELYDLDMQLLADITHAARQPKQGRRARVDTAALEAVLDAAAPDAEQLSRVVSHLAREQAHATLLPIAQWSLRPPHRQRYATSCLLHTRIMHLLSSKATHARAALSVFDALQHAGVELDVVCVNAAISAAGRCGDVDAALSLCNVLETTPGLAPDVFSYTALITAYGKAGRWDDAQQCFEDMSARGVSPNVVTYTSLMSMLQRAGQHTRAVALFSQMERDGVAADVTAYNAAMAACAKSRNWQRAWSLFSSMRHSSIEPNTVTYNTLISACERCGEVDRANEAFRIMQRHHASGSARAAPNAITFNTLISAAAKAGRLDEAVALLDAMVGKGLRPDAFTLSALMTACDRGGRPEQASPLWTRLVESYGVQPNTVSLNARMHAVSSNGDWSSALQLFQAMQADARTRPDVVSYGCIMRACERAGQWALAITLFDEMLEAGLRPNARVFASAIGACERGQQWERAIDLFRLMQDMEVSLDAVGMLVRRVAYSWPPLFNYLPAPVVNAAIATVKTGQAARRWVDQATTPPESL